MVKHSSITIIFHKSLVFIFFFFSFFFFFFFFDTVGNLSKEKHFRLERKAF
jgi:hypothetical protein